MTGDPFRPLKTAFGRFATGVVLAGCKRPDGASVFLTVNSFTSVSLSPPLVLWCLERRASTYAAFMSAEGYSINVLSAGQQALSERFSRHAPDPLGDPEVETWSSGAPVLKDALAAFDCKVVDRHSAGDHVVLIAEVLRFRSADGAPLLYFASRYAAGPSSQP